MLQCKRFGSAFQNSALTLYSEVSGSFVAPSQSVYARNTLRAVLNTAVFGASSGSTSLRCRRPFPAVMQVDNQQVTQASRLRQRPLQLCQPALVLPPGPSGSGVPCATVKCFQRTNSGCWAFPYST